MTRPFVTALPKFRELVLDEIQQCDSLELEAIITTLEVSLRAARERSDNGTRIDQRMYATRHEGTENATNSI
jgi:hypothetical protein